MNIVITGASRGIGKAIAEAFAPKAKNIFLVAQNKATLAKFKTALAESYPNCSFFFAACDLSQEAQIVELCQKILSFFSPDILINNAGKYSPGSVIEDPIVGNLEKMIATNLYSAYWLTQGLVPTMITKKSGHIFNICSIASIQPYPNGGAYSISKYALYGFNNNLREELKKFGIKVTAVIPGAVYTDSWKGANIEPERIMTTKDIAKMVVSAATLSPQACVEAIIIRPQLGDL